MSDIPPNPSELSLTIRNFADNRNAAKTALTWLHTGCKKNDPHALAVVNRHFCNHLCVDGTQHKHGRPNEINGVRFKCKGCGAKGTVTHNGDSYVFSALWDPDKHDSRCVISALPPPRLDSEVLARDRQISKLFHDMMKHAKEQDVFPDSYTATQFVSRTGQYLPSRQ